ncbi:MAG: hypothetical protein KF889_18460 [Alphaproteobacteria bacterium]|nr:hypothetical protein [Alphaproteobacteria bacterium]MCW5743949.1 hypothetical protein [Alphaproteobacteria bacterium]
MAQLMLMDQAIGTWPVSAGRNAYVYVVYRGSSVSDFIEKVYQETPDRVITSMSIYAHAAGSQVQNWEKRRTETSVAGFTLGQTVGDINLHLFAKLKSLFPKPRTYICNLLSCNQATSGPDYADPAGWGTSGKNLELCKLLAYYLNQYVRASDAPQHFDTHQGPLDRIMGERNVDFGTWEGNVYLFSPDGNTYKDKPKGRF